MLTAFEQLYLIHWPVAFTHGDGLFPKDPNDSNKIQLDKKTSISQTWKGKNTHARTRPQNL